MRDVTGRTDRNGILREWKKKRERESATERQREKRTLSEQFVCRFMV